MEHGTCATDLGDHVDWRKPNEEGFKEAEQTWRCKDPNGLEIPIDTFRTEFQTQADVDYFEATKCFPHHFPAGTTCTHNCDHLEGEYMFQHPGKFRRHTKH